MNDQARMRKFLFGRKGGVPKDVRAELHYAADAINAHQRGMSVPAVCLHYRYDPIQALTMIATCCADYGYAATAAHVPSHIMSIVQVQCPEVAALQPPPR